MRNKIPVKSPLERRVATEVINDGDVHLVLAELEGPVELVLPPAGHPAAHARPVTGDHTNIMLGHINSVSFRMFNVLVDFG